jgi:hypothetical protein
MVTLVRHHPAPQVDPVSPTCSGEILSQPSSRSAATSLRTTVLGGAILGVAVAALCRIAIGEQPSSDGLLLLLVATSLSVFVPWRVSQTGASRDPSPEVQSPPALARLAAGPLAALAVLVGAGVGAVVGGLGAPAAGGPLYLLVLSLGLSLVAWRGGEWGQAAASALGLGLLGLPFYAEPALGWLGEEARLSLVLHSPLPVLCGTYAGLDLLREPTLYRLFPLGQAIPYVYPSPLAALAVALGGVAAIFVGLHAAPRLLAWVALASRARRAQSSSQDSRSGSSGAARIVAAGALALVLFGAPAQAEAQLFAAPEGEGDSGPEIGDLETRVNLGYYLPILEGFVRLDGNNGLPGTKFTYGRLLDLEPIFIMPTFEVGFFWSNGGKVFLQYAEGVWNGEQSSIPTRNFEERIIPFQQLLETRYKWRSIAFGQELHIPLWDFLTARILSTQRYVRHDIRIRGFPNGFSGRNSLETVLPTLGLGVDVFIWNVISGYGDVQWLDITTNLLGGEDGRWALSYREWRVGVRFELVEHAHVMAEWYAIETRITDFKRIGKETYKQSLMGIRVQVAILF